MIDVDLFGIDFHIFYPLNSEYITRINMAPF